LYQYSVENNVIHIVGISVEEDAQISVFDILCVIRVEDYFGKAGLQVNEALINGGPGEGGLDLKRLGQVESHTMILFAHFRVESPDDPHWFFPNNWSNVPIIYIGDSFELNVIGGVPPYHWDIGDGYNKSEPDNYTWPVSPRVAMIVGFDTMTLQFSFSNSGWMDTSRQTSIFVDCTVTDDAGEQLVVSISILPRLGDVNGDGGIGISDAEMILTSITSDKILPPARWLAADVTNLSGVTVWDAYLIFQYAIDAISEFPQYGGKGAPGNSGVLGDRLVTDEMIDELGENGLIVDGLIDQFRNAISQQLSPQGNKLLYTWGGIKK